MVGSAILRRLEADRRWTPVTAERAELDLRNQESTFRFLRERRPTAVVVAAARVGGIEANRSRPAEFAYDNLAIAANAIEGARRAGVARLLYLGSSCIYPRAAPQPMPEEALLTGPLEPTNEGYAVAKIAGLKLCQYYRRQYGLCYHSAMPTNLYGPGDNYDPEGSHVLPAMIRRFREARLQGAAEVTLWGTGTPRREFLHVDDLAAAVLLLLGLDNPPDWINVGSGEEVTIRELAECVRDAVAPGVRLAFDPSRPDGMPRKLLDSRRLLALGWRPAIPLREGIARTARDYERELAAGTCRFRDKPGR
jgi:GDP-L-fucose synthase